MALLGGLSDRLTSKLHSSNLESTSTIAEIEAQAAALASLLQQAAMRLCPAASCAATDASLSLLSALKAVQLRLSPATPSETVAGMDRSAQQLLRVLQEGLAAPSPNFPPPLATPAADRLLAAGHTSKHQELAHFVRQLGFITQDWQAAQAGLDLRTAHAIHASRSEAAVQPAALYAVSTPGQSLLDSLLLVAVGTLAWQSSQPSLLHAAVQQLLWLQRELPLDTQRGQLRLSAEGWAAYWMLEPLALQQTLAEILQAATHQEKQQQQPGDVTGTTDAWTTLQRLLGRRPHWVATATAAARHPALHIAMRQTLHKWLAASGNPAAWRLLLLYIGAVRDAHEKQLERDGCLPAELRVLYPPGLSPVAALLHTQPPTAAVVAEAVMQLRDFLDGASAAMLMEEQGRGEGPLVSEWQQQAAWEHEEQRLASPAWRQEQVWQLLLDGPAWLLFCLEQLPLRQLLELAAMAAAGGGAAPPAAWAGANGLEPMGRSSQQAGAAEYVALLMWPGEPRRMQVLSEALLLDLGDVDVPALRPWLQMLEAWQQLLEGHSMPRDDAAPLASPNLRYSCSIAT